VIPEIVFTIMLWAAVVIIAGGAVCLLAVMIREWKDGNLW
jgi:hypothetical protein